MIIRSNQRFLLILLLWFLSIISFTFCTTTLTRNRTEPTISECAAKGGECDETKGRPVCGTDKQTYPTRCHLIRAQCSGHQVSLKHRGPCRECVETRNYALSHRTASPSKFVPRCRADGTYAPVQCMEGAGCWCSDGSGKPISNTAVRNGKPNCRKTGSKTNIRRSPSRNVGLNNGRGNISGGGINNGRNGGMKRGCSQVDQALFNTNLLKIFQSEYNRYSNQQQSSLTSTTVTDKMILDWKFSSLDTNRNNILDKFEYRELKRLIKKIIKPKRCARTFGKFCDSDQDERLSRNEWNNCLSKDGINRLQGNGDGDISSSSAVNINTSNNNNNNNRVHSSNTNNNNNYNHNHRSQSILPIHGEVVEMEDDEDDGSDQHVDDYDDSENYDDDPPVDDERSFRLSGVISSRNSNAPIVTQYPPVYLLRPKTIVESDPVLRESEGESDCLADRAAAFEEQMHGATALYIPECTADGRYQRVQCYRSTGYCWCVHEDTGKNIPGTSVKDKKPQCDSIYPTSRPMKGCPEPRKSEFLKDLKEFLKEKVAGNANSGVNTTKWSSEDEKIATLSFVLLDKNKNKVWERKEWKTFRELVRTTKSLRKCGKKMPRYCDVNSDKKITLSEWLNCLQTQRIPTDMPKATSNDPSKPTAQSKLKGPNPLESYLKSD